MNATLQDIILRHVNATGPVSLGSIEAYVAEQYNGTASSKEINAALTYLCENKRIAAFCDMEASGGVEFDSAAMSL